MKITARMWKPAYELLVQELQAPQKFKAGLQIHLVKSKVRLELGGEENQLESSLHSYQILGFGDIIQ